MITRAVKAEALKAVRYAEWKYWEEHPKEYYDLTDRWDGFQWNIVGAMIEQSKWEDLEYHLRHNLKETHIRDQIIHLLKQSVPSLHKELNLGETYWF